MSTIQDSQAQIITSKISALSDLASSSSANSSGLVGSGPGFETRSSQC